MSFIDYASYFVTDKKFKESTGTKALFFLGKIKCILSCKHKVHVKNNILFPGGLNHRTLNSPPIL